VRGFLRYLLVIIFLIFIFYSPLFAGESKYSSSGTLALSKPLKKGKSLFLHYCAHCHGNKGGGDGFNAEFLDKDPAELSSQKFQEKRSNKKIFRVIKEGGSKVKKSHLMPSFGSTLSEEEIWSLVAFVRYLGGWKFEVNVPKNLTTKRPNNIAISKSDRDTFSRWFSTEGTKNNLIKVGESLVMNKESCLGCHQLNTEGGRVGPNLNRSGFNYPPAWIYTWISNPQMFRPNTKMPHLGLSPKEARAITSFLISFEPDNEEEGGDLADSVELNKYLSIKGDSKRGETIFKDPEGIANCSKCHLVKTEGGTVGPVLSFIGTSRTREFLLESIIDPSRVITSGFNTIMILTKNRKFITGIKINEDESGLYIVDKNGKELHVPLDKIKKSKVQKISTMPGNFKDLLSTQDIADILAYLETLTFSEITPSVN
jgi:putative heme-binding domain-containing protein